MAARVKRRRLPEGAMQESAGELPAGGPTADERKRAALDAFETELLRVWLMDYPDWAQHLPTARTAERTTLLDALVQWGELPRGNQIAQLADMQRVWRKRNKRKSSAFERRNAPMGYWVRG